MTQHKAPANSNTAPHGSRTPAGTATSGARNVTGDGPDTQKTARGTDQTGDSTGPEAVKGQPKEPGMDQIESREVGDGVTDVVSHIDPTVPAPPPPNTAAGIDPAHPMVDTYPSPEAAAMAPGTHVPHAEENRSVHVVAHRQPPFQRVDGLDAGDGRSLSDAQSDAYERMSDAAGDDDEGHNHFVAEQLSKLARGQQDHRQADDNMAQRHRDASPQGREKLAKAVDKAHTHAQRVKQHHSSLK